MIRDLVWDSTLFGKKIGSLSLTPKTIRRLNRAIEDAARQGFAYISCRLEKQDEKLIKALESSGFHLSDIGVTWMGRTAELLSKLHDRETPRLNVRQAAQRDIVDLRHMSQALFSDSRFYSDPFFTQDDADRLFQTWIENSVKGAAADIVYVIPRTGFITCRKSGRNSGEIVLIGVNNKKRGKGVGTLLLKYSLLWFKDQKVHVISVRTQLKNIGSMNFYRRAGFSIGSYDVVYSKIL